MSLSSSANNVPAIIETQPFSPMDANEARRETDQAKTDLESARKRIIALRDRGAWQSLGYSSFDHYAREEFGQSYGHIYRLLRAAKVEAIISESINDDFCPKGQKRTLMGPIPETVLRPLTKFQDEPEKVRSAWNHAVESANGSRITARHVEAAVADLYPKRDESEADAFEDNPSLIPEPSPPPMPGQAAMRWERTFEHPAPDDIDEYGSQPGDPEPTVVEAFGSLPDDDNDDDEIIDVEYVDKSGPGDSTFSLSPAPAGPSPEELLSAQISKHADDMTTFLVTIPRQGGALRIVSGWPAAKRSNFKRLMDRLIDAASEFKAAIDRVEKDNK